ncbi:DUF4175 family protein [bacterium]|nr:DUF4175 family protein [bacterium]
MNKHAEYTKDRLETIRRSRARLRAIGLILHLSAVLLSVLVAVAMLDYWLLLPFAWRVVGAFLLAAVALFGVTNFVRWWRRPVSLKQIALELETNRPDLGCLVSTAAEHLEDSVDQPTDYAPELVATLHEHSARRLLQVEADWYQRELRRTGMGFGMAALAAIAFLLIAPAANLAYLRALFPWSNVAYTDVKVEPGSVELPVGENQSIIAGFTGRLPKDPQLEWRQSGDSRWRVLAMMPDQQNKFLQVLEKVRDNLVYRVRGAQAVSPEYQITTYVPPGIEDIAVQIKYPEYTGLEPDRVHQGNLSIVRGSRLQWTVSTSGEIAKARMRFASLPGFDLKQDTDGGWTAGFVPKQDLHYWIDLLDRKQRKGGSPQPYQVAVLPDEKPKAEVTEPGADIRANPLDLVPMTFEVSDDFGLTEAKLVIRKMDGTTKTFPLELKDMKSRDARLETTVDLTPFKLKPYELLSYYVEARDNNTLDGPGIGKSPVYFIEYTDKESPLSQCRKTGQGVNLLTLEKQIIASTMAIEDSNPPEKYADIAGIQRQTKKYAEMFGEAYQMTLAKINARKEFDAALRDMDASASKLDALERKGALENQESALQHLYEVCRLMPECQGMCNGSGNCFKIYLKAIEKLKQQTQKEREESLKALLAQAKELQRKQRELVDIYRAQKTNAPDGESQKKEGESKESGGANPSSMTGNNNQKAGELSEQQRKLAEQAAAIARLLEKLSGRDARVSHRYGQKFGQAANLLRNAAGNAGVGNFYVAEKDGHGGISVIGEVIYALEQLYDESDVSADLAAEAYPKAFESKINAYLKTLSYAE